MGISLSTHPLAYQITCSDLLNSLAAGVSGLPYAQRHSDLANAPSGSMAHRVIALIEYIPLIGGVVALIERVAYAIFGKAAPLAQVSGQNPQAITTDVALDKMIKNQNKACAEHARHYSWFRNPYASGLQVAKEELTAPKATPLTLSVDFAEDQGPRPTMEDAHFFQDTDKGILTGVFDGHGGSAVSAFAKEQFKKLFPEALRVANSNVRHAFETVINLIHEQVAKNAAWNTIGSTAVVCYIDKSTHQIYTATLGDSEANIYRKGVSIPLSCVRDWMSTRDYGRLLDAHGVKAVGRHHFEIKGQAKGMRSHLQFGVNVSRAIGDVYETGTKEKPLVIHKPKITVEQLKPGDTLVLACDGLKDYVDERSIVKIVGTNPAKVAQRLVDTAIANIGELRKIHTQAGDNVTVVAIKIT